jgi:ComF family protein
MSWGGSATRLFLDPVLAVVFPSECPACRAPVEHPTRGPLCEACWTALPRHGDRLCRCGVPLPPVLEGDCGRCRRGLSPFALGASLGPYSGSLRTLVHELKFRGRRRVARRLAEVLLASSSARRVLTSGAVVVPVPLHPRRRHERGYNQCELLAEALAEGAQVACCAGALARRRDTAPQSGLSAAARRANVAGAFVVRRAARIAGRVVVLVDDVMTTGATARACADALRRAGAAEVRVLTIARVA